MSGLAGAEQAAQLIAPQIGVAPSTLIGQFYAEDGASFSPSGTYNYGNLQPGGQEASYSSIGAFVSAFVQTIKDNFSAAENTGSNVAAYVAGLQPSSGPNYETGVSAAQYAANISTGATLYGGATVSGSTSATPAASSTPSITDKLGLTGDLYDPGQLLSGSTNPVATTLASTPTQAGANLASFLGLPNLSLYDFAFIAIGIILVLGSIFFIAKPAVQSVAINTAKVLK
jgi:hypothetical protein